MIEKPTIEKIFQQANKCKYIKRCYKSNVKIQVPEPDQSFGKKNIKILFVNERPGRIGPGKSGLISMSNNDPTAKFFKECFGQLKAVKESEILSTNACLCYPSFASYKDKPPRAQQIRNCTHWLKKQIEVLNPKLIVSLGNTALRTLKYCYPNSKGLKNFRLNRDIGGVIKDTTVPVYPLYHTSARARITRKANQQKKDWKKINDILKR